VLVQQSTRSILAHHTLSSQSETGKSSAGGSISPTSSSTSEMREKPYYVSGIQRRAAAGSQQTHFTFSVSPPLSQKTTSTTSPPPSTEEPLQVRRSSSSSASKDVDRTVVEISRRTDVKALQQGNFQDLETTDSTSQRLIDDSSTRSRKLSSNIVSPPGLTIFVL